MKKEYYLLLALITNTIFRFAPFGFYFGDRAENHTSFAVGQALSWVFLLLYIRDKFKTKLEATLFEITFWCAVSNTVDELLFNPLQLGWNEVVFALVITGREIFKYYKNNSNNGQCTG